MNCDDVRQELKLYFGWRELPKPLIEHLEICPECRKAWQESLSLADSLPADRAFFPEEEVAETLCRRLDNALPERNNVRSRARVWGVLKRAVKARRSLVPVPAAAALMLLVGLALLKPWNVLRETQTEPAVTANIDANLDSLVNMYAEASDESSFVLLLNEVTSREIVESPSWLLDDITEDELNYIGENLNAEDIL